MLDTDTASYIIKGHADVQAKLSAVTPSQVCVSAVTRAEIMYGLKVLPPNHDLHLAVRQFFQIVEVLAWNAEAADLYAGIKHRLARAREPIGDFDVMIASHALAANAVLVTNNTRHFQRIGAPLALQNWKAPHGI